MQVPSLAWEDSLEESMATYSNILAWRIPWTEEPGGLQSIGSQSQTTEHVWILNESFKNTFLPKLQHEQNAEFWRFFKGNNFHKNISYFLEFISLKFFFNPTAVFAKYEGRKYSFFPRDFRLKDFRMRCSRKKCRLWNWTETLHLTLILQVLWRKLLNDTLNCQMEIIPFPLQDIKIKPARHHMKSINLRA